METGIELIVQERQKQIDKYGFSGKHHAEHPEYYDKGQLLQAARHLSYPIQGEDGWFPLNWDSLWFFDLSSRPLPERLKIAGALIAAELDRLQWIKYHL